MPLVSMQPMLAQARAGRYAIGAFNAVDYLTTKAVIRAAEELHASVIVQYSVKTVQHWGANALANWMKELAVPSPVHVALHLDHCKSLEIIKLCIAAGWTSVMIDASSLPFDQNTAMSGEAARLAAEAGVALEAELGEIAGVEDDISVKDEDAHLADPQKALAFCALVKPAVFAPAIGTAHGVYKGEPKIAFDRLEEIARGTSIPLALHGGTGLSDEIIQRCIALGCAKVNISTQIKHAFIDAFCQYHVDNPRDYEPLKLLHAQEQLTRQSVAEKIRQFGSAGKDSSLD